MSDVGTGAEEEQPPQEPYRSEIDPAFSQAWNEAFSDSDNETPGEGTGAADASGSGDAAPAAGDQGAGSAPAADTASSAGDDLGALSGALQSAAAAGDPAAAETPPGTDGTGAATDPAAVQPTGVDVATITPLFAKANEAIATRMTETFSAQAKEEVESSVHPDYFIALDKHPYELVGQEVPSIRAEGGNIRLKDTEEAKNWQEATRRLLDREIQTKADAKSAEAQPIRSVLQESALMFQNNPDIVPGTLQYDQELADRFIEIAKNYELRIDNKLYGYQVNVQPLLNSLRADLAKQRGGAEKSAEHVRAEQQRRAAEQSRNQANGQFQTDGGPQAGIASRQGLQGGAPEGDDYSAFFGALGLPNLI